VELKAVLEVLGAGLECLKAGLPGCVDSGIKARAASALVALSRIASTGKARHDRQRASGLEQPSS
jgi:hypothetical protein